MEGRDIGALAYPIAKRGFPRLPWRQESGELAQPDVRTRIGPARTPGAPRIGDDEEGDGDQHDVQNARQDVVRQGDPNTDGEIDEHQNR